MVQHAARCSYLGWCLDVSKQKPLAPLKRVFTAGVVQCLLCSRPPLAMRLGDELRVEVADGVCGGVVQRTNK